MTEGTSNCGLLPGAVPLWRRTFAGGGPSLEVVFCWDGPCLEVGTQAGFTVYSNFMKKHQFFYPFFR